GVNDVVEVTLDAMACGGIHDQSGGGFARYSVDATWLVPHFEKMLYDSALLGGAYLHGWQALGHERWREVCERTLGWALREMRGPEGGFHSALDADSEGEEGRFYVWTPDEIRAVLGERADAVIDHYGVTEQGNFEGRNILHLPGGPGAEAPPGLDEARRDLYEVRSKREWPGLDDKRICSWNALMIAALADAGATLGRADYLDAAVADGERLIARRKDAEDHPIPSGNSSAAFGLLRLAALTGEHDYERRAVSVFRLFHRVAARHPSAVAHLLRALDFHFAAIREVALVTPAGGP